MSTRAGHTWHQPDEAMAAARTKVERLERAVDALGDKECAESRWLASEEARRAAQARPLAIQVAECQGFIRRSRSRQRCAGAAAEIARGDGQSVVSRAHIVCPHASGSGSHGGAPSVASSCRRDGSGERGAPEEVRKIFVRPITRFAWGSSAEHGSVSASREGQIFVDGHYDRSGRDCRREFESVQPIGLMEGPKERVAGDQSVRGMARGGAGRRGVASRTQFVASFSWSKTFR